MEKKNINHVTKKTLNLLAEAGELLGESESPWISVKDELPEDQEDVFTKFECLIEWAGGSRIEILHRTDRFWVDDGFEDANSAGENVTHWMKIPELQKETK